MTSRTSPRQNLWVLYRLLCSLGPGRYSGHNIIHNSDRAKGRANAADTGFTVKTLISAMAVDKASCTNQVLMGSLGSARGCSKMMASGIFRTNRLLPKLEHRCVDVELLKLILGGPGYLDLVTDRWQAVFATHISSEW